MQRLFARAFVVFAIASSVSTTTVDAAVFTVGTPGIPDTCTHGSVQAAIDAAAASPGADEVRIRIQPGGYPAQALLIDNQSLTIIGGFESCALAAPTGTSRLSGAGGIAAPVIVVRSAADNPISVELDRLEITDGDPIAGSGGGGLLIESRGVVRLSNTRIAANTATSGGGISLNAGPGALLDVGDGVVIEDNVASAFGGGIDQGPGRTQIGGVGTIVRGNSAEYGGGISVRGISAMGRAELVLRSGGVAGDGLLAGNTARFGGALLIGEFGYVEGYTTDPSRPLRINRNVATERGGAFAIRGEQTLVRLWESIIEGNRAGEGGGAFAIFGGASMVVRNASDGSFPLDGAACFPQICNRIQDNAAVFASNARFGAVASMQHSEGMTAAALDLASQHVAANRGSSLFNFQCSSASCLPRPNISIGNSLVAPNHDTPQLATSSGDASFGVFNSTIAQLGDAGPAKLPLIESSGSLLLSDSILWAPGRDVLGTQPLPGLLVQNLLIHDATDFPVGASVRVGNPLFLSPDAEDFRLAIGSAAIDVADEKGAPPVDLLGAPRVVDQPTVPNALGALDVGAYEAPLVFDPVFASGFE